MGFCCPGAPARRAGADLGVRATRRPVLDWTSAGFTKPLRLVLELLLRPEREIAVQTSGGVVQERRLQRPGAAPDRRADLPTPPVPHSPAAVHARRLQSGSLGTYVAYLIGLVVVLLAAARIGLIG